MAKKATRKPSAAFMKPVQPSAALSEVVGAKPMPRTEVTKKLWAYIKKHGLQDTKNKDEAREPAPDVTHAPTAPTVCGLPEEDDPESPFAKRAT